jgi:hypothetical protein
MRSFISRSLSAETDQSRKPSERLVPTQAYPSDPGRSLQPRKSIVESLAALDETVVQVAIVKADQLSKI